MLFFSGAKPTDQLHGQMIRGLNRGIKRQLKREEHNSSLIESLPGDAVTGVPVAKSLNKGLVNFRPKKFAQPAGRTKQALLQACLELRSNPSVHRNRKSSLGLARHSRREPAVSNRTQNAFT